MRYDSEENHPPLPQNIPISKGEYQGDSLKSNSNTTLYENPATCLSQCYAGPVPADKFVTAFLNVNSLCDDEMPSNYDTLKALFHSGQKTESDDISDSLVSI